MSGKLPAGYCFVRSQRHSGKTHIVHISESYGRPTWISVLCGRTIHPAERSTMLRQRLIEDCASCWANVPQETR